MNRREFVLASTAAATLSRAAFATTRKQLIDRAALVKRHNPVLTAPDISSPLQVGNGNFAFTADITGLQTFPEAYERGMRLGTQSSWGWHSFPNPNGYKLEDVLSPYGSHGRPVPYPDAHGSEAFTNQSKAPDPLKKEAAWLFANPQRIHLGFIGLILRKTDGGAAKLSDVASPRQELDLWTGMLTSEFQFEGQPVRVLTTCPLTSDRLAIRIESPWLASQRLAVSIAFPCASGDFLKTYDWNSPDKHQTSVTITRTGVEFARVMDETRYWVKLDWSRGGTFTSKSAHHYEVYAPNQNELELLVTFSPAQFSPGPLPETPRFRRTQEEAANNWQRFWGAGGAMDLSSSTDPRAEELERRIVLSQYLTRVNCAGSLPPQETGLVVNSWCGKFHLEMHWWHAAHFVPWGRAPELEASLSWYESILPVAKATAKRQGYQGARWPKQVGPDGREAPSNIGPFLIWQQPHPIYYAELLYRARPTQDILKTHQDLVFESAEFMASYAWWDEANGRYVLGPPLIPAQEGYWTFRERVINPTFELAYWQWGLSTAQKWRERLHMPRDSNWDKVIAKLSRPTVRNGLYTAIEVEPYTQRSDHPSLLYALGFVPKTLLIDVQTMARTYDDVLANWDWKSTWGWDYPAIAMTAARLGDPKKAMDALMMDAPKNHYLKNGHNLQVPGFLPLYLPGNGGLLYAVAMMAAGWDGAPAGHAPGFPNDGHWKVQFEGLQVVP